MEDLALEYFRGLDKEEKKRIMKKIIASLSTEEKIELAKLILGK
jgi:hypothetical protein